jgi:hypothetical protein
MAKNKKNNETIEPEITVLTTNRKKTIDFYNKYKNFDFEQMNDMMIDFFENIINNISGEMNNSITKDLILMIKEQNHHISTLKTDIDLMKNNIVIKLYDIKKEYIDDIKLLIDKNDSDNISKIIDKVEKENTKLIQDIVPKTNAHYYAQYELLIKNFKEDIKNNNQSELLENKYNNFIKNIESSLINYISKTEERIQTNLSEIKNNEIINFEAQHKVNDELVNYLDKYKNSTQKGSIAENYIENLLNNIYKTADITRTTDESKSGDFIMSRENFIPILFEIKNYNRNVPTDEVNKFVRDINDKNMSGIMMSITHGICNKYNFQIDITDNNNICIYIHDMNYDPDKLRLAVDIIDNLYSKLKISINKNKDITIDTDTLELINNEYQTFIQKRDLAINHVKDSYKKTIQYIEELELMNLNKFLNLKLSFNNTSTLECEICKKFVGTNLKSLAAHKRKCKKNIIIESTINNNNDNDTEKSNDNIIIEFPIPINENIINESSINEISIPDDNKKKSKKKTKEK